MSVKMQDSATCRVLPARPGHGKIRSQEVNMKNSFALLFAILLAVVSSAWTGCNTNAASSTLRSSNMVSAEVSPSAGPVGPIAPTFFGMHINRLTTPWPSVPFRSLRMLGNLTTWFHIEGDARNRYDWRTLDRWLDAARAHNVDVMYTFSRTPGWAARNAHSTCGPSRDEADCSPPADLATSAACQGPLQGTTTTDCYFKEFVTSLLDHVCSGKAPNKSCRIVAFSCWNEPNLDGFWI